MKKLFYLLMLLLFAFVVSSIFRGGEYVRLISSKTGVNLAPVAQFADSLSLGDFMDSHSVSKKNQDKKRIGS